MRVLHTITGIQNRDGGPFRSVPALARGQQSLGGEVSIAAIEIDDSILQTNSAGEKIKGFPRSFPDSMGRSRALRQHLLHCPTDIVHHHGLWHRTLHYAHKKALRDQVPLVIAPRGMMMPWAWAHNRRRKKFAETFFHPGALSGADGWHATSEGEAEAIRGLGFTQPICVAPNGVDLPSPESRKIARAHWLEREPSLADRRVALFYGRFHEKKRLIECIDLWHQIAPREWTLLVVGIPDQFSTEQIRNYVLSIGANAHVKVFDGIRQPPPFAVAELFLLTSHSENFGMAVAESLANGVPAAVTHGAPWQGLNDEIAGWWVDWGDYPATLKGALNMIPDTLRERGQKGHDWMRRDFSWERSAEHLLQFYHEVRPRLR